MILHPDKFGYYSVGNRTTCSRTEAFEWGEPSWHFNDDIFLKLDWKVEPNIPLKELYKIRCRQIREAYDYVVIMYSGGSDSHNIITHWIEAGCKIDEIASWWPYEAAKGVIDPWMAEISKAALPFIKEIKNNGIDFKFRLVDASKNFYDVFKLFGKEYEYNINFIPIPFSCMSATFRENEPEYKKITDKGKKVCFVWGHDKPQLFYKDGKYFTRFTDNVDSSVGPYIQRNYNKGWYDELFYWTPDLPEIVQKQVHILKSFIRTNNDPKYYYDNVKGTFNDPPIHGYNPVLNKFLHVDTVKLLLYPNWSLSIYNAGKSVSGPMFPEKAKFFLEGNNIETKVYKAIMNSYMKKAKYSKGRLYSPKYYLE